MPSAAPHVIAEIDRVNWAITQDGLNAIRSIASRVELTPKMLEAIQGRQIDRTSTATMRDGGIAIIPVTGPIFRHADLFSEISGATALTTLATDFAAAQSNPQTRHILLDIASPGGEAEGIIEFSDQIARSSVPVTAYISGHGASAAYSIAAAATQTGGFGVVIAKMGIAGSVGVVVSVYRDNDQDENGSVEFVSSGAEDKRPDMDTDEGRGVIQSLVDTLGVVFVEAIAGYRELDRQDVFDWRGGVEVGKDAVAAGMADNVGDFESLIQELQMAGKTVQVPAATAIVEAPDLSAVTRDEFRDANPDVYKAIAAGGFDEGEKHGAAQVIKGVQAKFAKLYGEDVAMSGLLWDQSLSVDGSVFVELDKDKARKAEIRGSITVNRATPLEVREPSDSSAKPAAIDKNLPVEQRAQLQWDSDPETRSSFGSLGEFESYMRAVETGRVRIAPSGQQ